MLKNVASQKIGAQMVSATDGSAFTGAVTVSVTGDAGTQATGSVGSGACTHEGNGYHTYAPAQAETNYDLAAFTFTGSGAIPVTVQVYTLPTTGILAPTTAGRTLDVSAGGEAGLDWANIGSPTTAVNLSGTTVKTATDVETDTADIQSRLPAALGANGNLKADVRDYNGTAGTFSGGRPEVNTTLIEGSDATNQIRDSIVDDATRIDASALNTATGTTIPAIVADTDELQTDWSNGGRLDNILDARASQTSVDDLPTNAELATALAAADDAVLAAIGALNDISPADVNAEVVDALSTDTYAEPGQGTPGATISIAQKIGYLYKALRNRTTQTADTYSLYNDDASTVGQKATVSDDGTTFERTELITGA